MRVASSSLRSSSLIVADDVEQIAVDTSAEVHLDEWIAPELVDDNGLLRVGRILEWMDVGGALAASRYCRSGCVTASVNGVDIYRPIEVGEHVSMTARVAHTSRRSMGVHVSLRARGTKLLSESEVLSAYMTFVVGDGGGELNPWTPLSPRDRALFREGELRREFRQKLAAGDFADEGPETAQRRGRVSLRTLARDVRRIVPFVPDPARIGARSPETSYVHRIEPVMAGSLNMHGTLYGGTLMRWIENAASMSARAFTDSPMVVLGVHGLDFLKPVSNHVFLHTHAMAVRSDKSSVTIRVEVTSEKPTNASVEQNLRGYFTYRPLDRRVAVPELAVHSDAEHALCSEAAHHLAFARRLREQ
ncbi:MAG: acyl-CoA thioesterase [Polyangiales bacterium]